MMTVNTVALLQLLLSASDASFSGDNMNGEYRISNLASNSNFSANFRDYPGGVEYFEVYHGPINSTYGEVWWTRGTNAMPAEVVKRFDGKVMAIVGIEMDQVRKTPQGDVPVPINMAYNHHHDTAVVGKGTELEEMDRRDPRVQNSPHGPRHFIRLDHGKVWAPKTPVSERGNPTSAMFSDGNGGEYRKTLHMAPPGYAQLVESPVQLSGSPMQIDTWNRDKMDINGGPFVPGPVPKRSLAPLVGPDAVYSGLLECPLTSRIKKVFDGGAGGWNDTTGAAVFGCPGAAGAPSCQKQAGNNCGGVATKSECGTWFVPGGSSDFNCVWSNGKCTTSTTPCEMSNQGTCQHQFNNSAACFAAGKALPGLTAATFSTATTTSNTVPPGCSVVVSQDGTHAQLTFNTKADSSACCGVKGGEVVGSATSLVTLKLAVSDSKQQATITMTGPSQVWFGVGFGATLMDDMPYAIIVEGTGAVSERQLAKESPGTLLNVSVKVVSNTVVAGVRTVVLTRALKGKTKVHYTFDPQVLQINFINALGSTPMLSYHKSKTATSINLFPSAGSPACVCSYPAAPFGQGSGSIKYLPTGESVGFKAGRCAPHPRTDLIGMKNPTCDVRTYTGGLMTCHHKWVLLDAEQEQPWVDQPLVYYKKFRVYYQEYDASKHANLYRQDWGIGADGDHSEYDVIQCPKGTPAHECTQTITGTWMPVPASSAGVHMVKAHFHCHAPTCIKMELWNNDTGKILCRESTLVGGTGKIDLKRFDEPGYIAVPPCLWGSPKDGLQPPPLMTGMTIKVVSLTNNTYGHHGEMALPELSFVTL